MADAATVSASVSRNQIAFNNLASGGLINYGKFYLNCWRRVTRRNSSVGRSSRDKRA